MGLRVVAVCAHIHVRTCMAMACTHTRMCMLHPGPAGQNRSRQAGLQVPIVLEPYWNCTGVAVRLYFGCTGLNWGCTGDLMALDWDFTRAVLEMDCGFTGAVLGLYCGSTRALPGPVLRLCWVCTRAVPRMY